jgi:alkylhydroperoxidase family enzyme
MTRITGATIEDGPEEMREAFAEQEKRYGFVTNTTRVYALRPTIYKGVQALGAGIAASGLIEPELRHLVCVKTAAINGCPF